MLVGSSTCFETRMKTVQKMKDRILFVCQRYGEEVNGGAEAECRMYAEHLNENYDVDVLTTCALDYVTWENYYPEGVTQLNGVRVIRFPVNKRRQTKQFDEISSKIVTPHTDEEELLWLESQGPFSPDCIDYLKKNGKSYHSVLFMTYLYYTTAMGILEDLNNVILIPTAHDEWPIYLRHYRKVFGASDRIIYNADGEKRFVEKLYPEVALKPSVTVGIGINIPQGAIPDVKDWLNIEAPYLCYCGRIDESKGCRNLFQFFSMYKKRKKNELKLVLTGKAVMSIPEEEGIISLGFVSEEKKLSVLKDSVAFVLASEYESLSIVVLESMMMGRPVLVNGRCEVLRDHCVNSNAGLYFTDYYEFEAALDWLFSHPDEYEIMRKNGKNYVEKNYRWETIIQKIISLIEQ